MLTHENSVHSTHILNFGFSCAEKIMIYKLNESCWYLFEVIYYWIGSSVMTVFSISSSTGVLLRQKQSHLEREIPLGILEAKIVQIYLDWSLPNIEPSSKVWGRVRPAVSGKKNAAKAPTIEHNPRMRRGRIKEYLA